METGFFLVEIPDLPEDIKSQSLFSYSLSLCQWIGATLPIFSFFFPINPHPRIFFPERGKN